MNLWRRFQRLVAYLAPELSCLSPHKHLAVVATFLALAAIAGAVVLKPSYRAKPDFWQILRQRIAARAQVDLYDDFSQGLDAWASSENRVSNWKYDKNGFVNVGALSLFEPTLLMRNYDVDALVQIQTKGVGLVFRATSLRNYQVARLQLDGSGAMPAIALERYAVVSGLATRPVVTRFPQHFQSDTMYRLHMEVRGDAFALYIQGNLMDYWSDSRLGSGGVGLFCSPGERARVAWVRVRHNRDSIGRMCSLLSSLF